MSRIEKTVFISYRRINIAWALAIFQNLKNEGYDVFFDYLSISSGNFEKIITENIKARAHFIILLTPSALERCSEPNDWLRREIETAIEEKRNIVPVMLENFNFNTPANLKILTGKLENLKKYNGLPVYSEYFLEGMNRLREQFLNIALDAVVHPVSENTKQVTKEHQNAASEAEEIIQEQLNAKGAIREIDLKKFYVARNPDGISGNIDRILQELAKVHGGRNPKIKFQTECSLPSDIRIPINEDWLKRGLNNIIDNAVDAVNADNIHQPIIILRSLISEGLVHIEVEDNTKGIAEKLLNKVFYTEINSNKSKDSGQGYGLGLLVTRSIVEANGGHVSIKESNKQGTTFVFEFPILDGFHN